MQVSVVNSYDAASLSVEVIRLRKVDCKKDMSVRERLHVKLR